MSNCPIPSDDFIEEYLQEKLTPEKKAELQQMRDEWEQARQEALEHKKNNEYWKFLVSTWWEQGCGVTVILMMTQKSEEEAINKFKEIFGEYDVEFITREKFFTEYSHYLPQKLVELKDQLCSIEYHSKLHFNFS